MSQQEIDTTLLEHVDKTDNRPDWVKTFEERIYRSHQTWVDFIILFKRLSDKRELDDSLYYVCDIGMKLLEQAKEKNNNQVPKEQITNLAVKLIRLCNRRERAERWSEQDDLSDDLSDELFKDFETTTEINLLAALYASYELQACDDYFYFDWINPFSWYALASDYLRTSEGSKVGRKRLEDSPEKMQAVEKVISENPRAPDKTLIVKLALYKGIASNTAANWLKAYRNNFSK